MIDFLNLKLKDQDQDNNLIFLFIIYMIINIFFTYNKLQEWSYPL